MSVQPIRRNPRRKVRDTPKQNSVYIKTDVDYPIFEEYKDILGNVIQKKYIPSVLDKSDQDQSIQNSNIQVTPYQEFVKKNYSKIAKENPTLKFVSVMDIIHQTWDKSNTNTNTNTISYNNDYHNLITKLEKENPNMKHEELSILISKEWPKYRSNINSSSSNSIVAKDAVCQYGSNCYRKNPKHIQLYHNKASTLSVNTGTKTTSDASTIASSIPVTTNVPSNKPKSEKYPSDKITKTTTPKEKCISSDLKVGDFVSRISYCKITKTEPTRIWVENESKYGWNIGKEIVEKEMFPASHYSSIEKCTMTRLAELIMNAKDAAFTVCFEYKLTPEHIETILDENKNATNKKLSKLVLSGNTRVLIGRLDRGEPTLGRSRVIDLEVGGYRFVDHRTIKWFVYKNVKYELK